MQKTPAANGSKVVVQPFLLLAVAFTLSACTGGKSAERVGKNAPEMCAFQPEEGERAIMSNAGRVDYVKSRFFDKSYNRYDLEATLGASGVETARYASAIDVLLLRIPYNGKADRCLYLESLPLAPDNIQDYWKSRTGGRLNNGLGGILGLYRPVWDNEAGKMVQLVLVRSSTDRWTLAHELLHANFHKTRIALSQDSSGEREIAITQLEASDRLNWFDRSRTESELLKVVESYNKLADLHIADLANSSLEEVANESLLMDEYAAGRFKNVSRLAAVDAAWYINCSREKSLVDLNAFAKKIESTLLNPARSAGWLTAQTQASAILAKISALNSRTLELAMRAKSISGATDADIACSPQNREVQARLANKNPHLIEVIEGHPGLRAFKQALRDLGVTTAKIRERGR